MKKLLLSLMVLATLTSCGKNNTVSSAAPAGTIGITNPLVTGSTQAQTLIAAINNPAAFGQGAVPVSGSGQTCKNWGILQYCYSSSSGSTAGTQTWNQLIAANPGLTYLYTNGLTVRNSDVVVATKQAELVALLNSATNIEINGYAYIITTAAGKYAIDIRYPIQLQPSAVNSNSGSYYFYQAI